MELRIAVSSIMWCDKKEVTWNKSVHVKCEKSERKEQEWYDGDALIVTILLIYSYFQHFYLLFLLADYQMEGN